MKRLLPLYPRAWRERYGAEMGAVLDDAPFDPWAALDLVACAVDAHLHQPRGWRRPAGLSTKSVVKMVAQVAMLVVAAMVALPTVRQLLEGPALSAPGGSLVVLLLPAAIPALAAVASQRVGWSLGAWFFGLLAADVAVSSGDDWVWAFVPDVRGVQEPVWLVATVWPTAWFRLDRAYVAAVIVLGAALVAVLLRRVGIRWPVGLAIGILLVGSTAFVPLALSLWPGVTIGYASLVAFARWAAWSALTAALLGRGGLRWWAALPSGVILGPLLSSAWLAPGDPWPLPGALWAATLAALVCRRGAAPAPREAAPC